MTWKNELPLIASAGVIEMKFDMETSRKIREAADKAGRNVADCVVAMVNFAIKHEEHVTKNNGLTMNRLLDELKREQLRGVREVGLKDSHFEKQELGNFSSSTPR